MPVVYGKGFRPRRKQTHERRSIALSTSGKGSCRSIAHQILASIEWVTEVLATPIWYMWVTCWYRGMGWAINTALKWGHEFYKYLYDHDCHKALTDCHVWSIVGQPNANNWHSCLIVTATWHNTPSSSTKSIPLIARFMRPTEGLLGFCRPPVGPM